MATIYLHPSATPPRAVRLGFHHDAQPLDAPAGPPALAVEITDLRTGAIVAAKLLRETAHWLIANGYRWVPGSQGVWARS